MAHRPATPSILGLLLLTVSWSPVLAAEALEKTRTNRRDGAKLVLVPAGRFLMGSVPKEIDPQFTETGLPVAWKTHTKDESPRHARSIDAFYM
jgi:formylglycine-generating enzyme required for sulfatase activity